MQDRNPTRRQRRLARRIAAALGVLLVVAAPGSVHAKAQFTAPNQASVIDSLMNLPFSFRPDYAASISGRDSRVEFGHTFRSTITMPRGITLASKLAVKDVAYRIQDKTETDKDFENTITKLLGVGQVFTLAQTDNRFFSRVLQPGGRSQDVVSDNSTLRASYTYIPLTWDQLRYDGYANAVLNQYALTFKTDESASADGGLGVGYSLENKRAAVYARVHRKQSSDESVSNLGTRFKGLSTAQDSLEVLASVRPVDSVLVEFNYMNYNSDREYLDQARSSTGTQSSELVPESEIKDAETIGFSMRSGIGGRVSVRLSTEQSFQGTRYREQSSRNAENTVDNLKGSVQYRFSPNTSFRTALERRETDRELFSITSFREKVQRASFNLTHKFGLGKQVSFDGSTQLTQIFYKDPEQNPRDRDQLNQQLSMNLVASPFPKVASTINMIFTQIDFVNIDGSLSADNRIRRKFDLTPRLRYNYNERISVSQVYGLSLEFNEFTQGEAATEDDFLDRNVTFSNIISAIIAQGLSGELEYELQLHDRGRSFNDGIRSEVEIEREDRTDIMKIRARYSLTPAITVVAENTYSNKRDETVGSDRITNTSDGSVEGGVIGRYNWGSGRKLDFTLVKVNKFSPFTRNAKQNDFWRMQMDFAWAF